MHDDDTPLEFRQQALDKFSQSTSLDGMLPVVSPSHWLFVLGLTLMTVAFLFWLVIGQLFMTVAGKGILLGTGVGITSVESAIEVGTIRHLYVSQGQHIEKDSLLVEMDTPLKIQLEAAETYLLDLQKEQQLSRQELSEKLRSLEKLPQQSAADKAHMLDLKDTLEDRYRHFSLEVMRQAAYTDALKKRWEMVHYLRSPITGMVAEVRVKSGEQTKPDEVLLTIVPEKPALYAVVFVPASHGKLIKSGMQASIQPSMFNTLEYGAIQGIVESVSSLPASKEYITMLLQNTALANLFLSHEPLITLKVKLILNPNTSSGYAWTDGTGPDFQFTQGTLVSANIEIETRSPLEFLMRLNPR